jgi:hypothetical protein
MSSLIIGEARETTYKNELVTASLIPKYFLICESCFWCASYWDFYYYNLGKVLKSQDIMTARFPNCPTCGTNKAVKSLPLFIGNRRDLLQQERIVTNQ